MDLCLFYQAKQKIVSPTERTFKRESIMALILFLSWCVISFLFSKKSFRIKLIGNSKSLYQCAKKKKLPDTSRHKICKDLPAKKMLCWNNSEAGFGDLALKSSLLGGNTVTIFFQK